MGVGGSLIAPEGDVRYARFLHSRVDMRVLDRLIPVGTYELDVHHPSYWTMAKSLVQSAAFLSILFTPLLLGFPFFEWPSANVVSGFGVALLAIDVLGARKLRWLERWLESSSKSALEYEAWFLKCVFSITDAGFFFTKTRLAWGVVLIFLFWFALDYYYEPETALDYARRAGSNLLLFFGPLAFLGPHDWELSEHPPDDNRRRILYRAFVVNTVLLAAAIAYMYGIVAFAGGLSRESLIGQLMFNPGFRLLNFLWVTLFINYSANIVFELRGGQGKVALVAWVIWLLGMWPYLLALLPLNILTGGYLALRSAATYAVIRLLKRFMPQVSILRLAGIGLAAWAFYQMK